MHKSLLMGTGLVVGFVLMTGMGLMEASPGPSGPSFKASRFSRLRARTEELESTFQWPSEAAFRRTHSKFAKARPIPLVRGRLVVIRGREALQALGPAPSWREVTGYLAAEAQDKSNPDGAQSRERSRVETASEISVRDCPVVVMGFWEQDGVWVGSDFLGLQDCQESPRVSSLESLEDGRAIIQADEQKLIAFKPASPYRRTSPRTDLWDAWTYTSTLLELNRPLYDSVPDSEDETPAEAEERFKRVRDLESAFDTAMKEEPPENRMAAIRWALAQDIDGSSHVWGRAARFAEQAGDLELALKLRSRYRPIGACSMDTAPQEAARDYSELCFRMGDLPCFLNLQVRIMGDAFQRVAYSSYGEAAHGTEAERLRDIGIDVGRFLKGLVVQFAFDDGDRAELGVWRLARSIKEIDEDLGIESFLDSVASDPEVDPFNRLRATMIQVYLAAQRELPAKPDKDAALAVWEKILGDLNRQPLSAEAQLWIEALESTILRAARQ